MRGQYALFQPLNRCCGKALRESTLEAIVVAWVADLPNEAVSSPSARQKQVRWTPVQLDY